MPFDLILDKLKRPFTDRNEPADFDGLWNENNAKVVECTGIWRVKDSS
jgi:hypothetical protein